MNKTQIKKFFFAFSFIIASCAEAAPKDDFYSSALELLEKPDLKGAVIELKNALQLDTEFIAAWLKLSGAYLQVGNGSAAEITLKKAQSLGADPKLTLVPLARSYLLQSKIPDLLELKAPRGFPKNNHAELLIIQGNALLEGHLLKEAETLFTKASQLAPSNPAHLYGRAMAALRSNKPEAALNAAEQALNLAPSRSESWYVSGEINRNLGNSTKALAQFSKAIEISPLHLPARIGRASVLMSQEALADAKVDLDVVTENDERNLQGLYLNGVLHNRLGATTKGDEYLDKATELIKGLPDEIANSHSASRLIIATLYLRSKDFYNALAPLERFLKNQPYHRGARRMLAQCYLNTDAAARARKLLQNLIAEDPKKGIAHWLLGEAYSRLDAPGPAERSFRKATELGYQPAHSETRLGIAMAASGNLEDALRAFESAAENEPDNPNPWLAQYNLYLAQNKPREALKIIEELLVHHPESAEYHNMAGAVNLVLGERDATRVQFNQSIALNPEFLTPHLNLTEMLRQEGDLDAATTKYRELIKQFGQEARIARGMAEIALQRRQISLAIEWLEKVRAIDSDSIGDRIVLANTYAIANDFDNALKELNNLREEHPLNLDIALAQANILHKVGETGAVEDTLGRATGLAIGDTRELSKVAAMQRELGYYQDAIRNLNRVKALTQSHFTVNKAIGELQIQTRNYAQALIIAEQLISQKPRSPEGYLLKGKVHYSSGRFTEAIEAFQKFVDLTDGKNGHIDLARSYQASGDVPKAIDILRARLEVAPTEKTTRMFLAEYLAETDQIESALVEYETIISLAPDDFAAVNNFAVLLAKMGDPRAIILAEKAHSLRPNSPAALDTLGWVLMEQNQYERSLTYLREAYARDSSNPEIKLHLATCLVRLEREITVARALLEELLNEPNSHLRPEAEHMLTQILDAQT